MTKIDEAQAFLRQVLPNRADEIQRLAREAGIAEKTLRRAGKQMDVVTEKRGGVGRGGVGGHWWWRLDDEPEYTAAMRGIRRNPPPPAIDTRTRRRVCPDCGTKFLAARANGRYCSNECGQCAARPIKDDRPNSLRLGRYYQNYRYHTGYRLTD
jgi:ribosomal protein S27AE